MLDVTPKDLRVTIPVHLHLKLHHHRLMTGKLMSDAVTQALEEYFERHQDVQRNDAR